MTVKSTRAAQTGYSVADGPGITFPNGDWTVGFVFILDGTLTGNALHYLLSTGGYQAPSSLNIFWKTTDSGTNPGRLAAYVNGSGSESCFSPTLEAGKAYQGILQRSANVVSVKVCPTLLVAPTTGSAVLAGTTPVGLTVAMDTPNYLALLTRTTYTNAQNADESAGRFFMLTSVLTDLEIAKLAYGMEITELGYTPQWYFRLNDNTDTADRGTAGLTLLKTGTINNGASPGFGYVPTNSPPVFTSVPAIIPPVQVGTSVAYTRGTVTGTPTPNSTQQWTLDGADISGATGTTYIPTVDQVGKALRVRQTATSTEGSASSTSDPVTITAAVNAITVAELVAEKIYPRNGTSAAVPLSITYTGTQPTSIEYQLYAVDRATVRQAWAAAGATIVAGGTATASPLMPQGQEKYTIAVRSKDASGVVLATSVVSTNRFGVGLWIACAGSSSSTTWFGSGSGGSFTPNTSTTSYADPNGFRNFDANGVISQAALYFAQQFGCVVGMLSVGQGGTTATDLANTGSSLWSYVVSGLTLIGNRLEGLWCSTGSNDASNNYLVTSVDQHLGKLRTIISNVRTQVSQSMLPVLWSGMNSRPGSSGNAAGQDPMSDWVRSAENILAYDANVFHVSALDLTVGPDGVHLTGSGFQAQMARIQYVWIEAVKNGVYRRGPRITAFTFLGNAVTAALEYRQPGASDFTPTTGAIGFTVTDASGTPGVVSVTRQDATHPKITFDRTLVAPVVAKFLSGGAPSIAAPIYDNATVPLPMVMEATIATAEGTADTGVTNSLQIVDGRLRRSATGAVIPNGKRLRVS